MGVDAMRKLAGEGHTRGRPELVKMPESLKQWADANGFWTGIKRLDTWGRLGASAVI
jgi:hypothetical protein